MQRRDDLQQHFKTVYLRSHQYVINFLRLFLLFDVYLVFEFLPKNHTIIVLHYPEVFEVTCFLVASSTEKLDISNHLFWTIDFLGNQKVFHLELSYFFFLYFFDLNMQKKIFHKFQLLLLQELVYK